jgi:predicted transglutaminase-like cysteine proteinase
MMRVLILVLFSMFITPAPAGSGWMAFTNPAEPTKANVVYCQENPTECGFDLSQPEILDLTQEQWNTIRDANYYVNRNIQPVEDKEDNWKVPFDGFGDCEDMVLMKRLMLERAGIPRRTMRLTFVLDPDGRGHLVLTIRTTAGDFILDNLTNKIDRWDRRNDIKFVKIENDRGNWVYIQ